MDHGEVVPHPKDEGDELARRFIIPASAREALEEHAASGAIRRAAATRPCEDDIWDPQCGLVERHTCALLNTCEESRRTKRVASASVRGESWTSCSGQPGRCPKTTRT